MASNSGTSSNASKNDNNRSNFTMRYDILQKAKDAIYTDTKKQDIGIAIKRPQSDQKTSLPQEVDIVCSYSTTCKPQNNIKLCSQDSSFVETDCLWKVVVIKYKNKKQ